MDLAYCLFVRSVITVTLQLMRNTYQYATRRCICAPLHIRYQILLLTAFIKFKLGLISHLESIASTFISNATSFQMLIPTPADIIKVLSDPAGVLFSCQRPVG